jgi:hypothetical protein
MLANSPYSDVALYRPFDPNSPKPLRAAKGAPHGLCTTHKDEVNAHLFAFIERKEARKAA